MILMSVTPNNITCFHTIEDIGFTIMCIFPKLCILAVCRVSNFQYIVSGS